MEKEGRWEKDVLEGIFRRTIFTSQFVIEYAQNIVAVGRKFIYD